MRYTILIMKIKTQLWKIVTIKIQLQFWKIKMKLRYKVTIKKNKINIVTNKIIIMRYKAAIMIKWNDEK